MAEPEQTDLSTLHDVLGAVSEFLDRQSIPYALAGGLAVAVWGQPRSTFDVDLVVVGEPQAQDRLSQAIRDSSLLVLEPHELPMHPHVPILRAHVKSTNHGEPALIVTDFLTVEESFAHSIVSRRIELPVGGRLIWVCSPEDLMLLKLLSGRAKDLEDCRGIVQSQADAIDRRYLQDWAAQLECSEACQILFGE